MKPLRGGSAPTPLAHISFGIAIPTQNEVTSIGLGAAYAALNPIDATSYKNGIKGVLAEKIANFLGCKIIGPFANMVIANHALAIGQK